MTALLGGAPSDPAANAARLDAYNKGGTYNPGIGRDPRAIARAEELKKQQGADANAAGGRGIANGVTLNAAGEISALGDTLRGGDPYGVNNEGQQIYEDYLRQTHPAAYAAGEFGGGLVLAPLAGAATTPGQLVGTGAAFGAVNGFNSGQGVGGRLGNAALGAVAGAAGTEALGAGYGGQALAARNAAINAERNVGAGGISAATEAAAMREKQIAAAAAAQEKGIDMPRFVAGGPTAQRLGAIADQSPIGAPIVRRAAKTMLDQSEADRNKIASNLGTVFTNEDAMGERAIEGAKTARSNLKGDYRRMYQAAEQRSGDVRVPLPLAKQNVEAQIAELSDTPGGAAPKILSTMREISSGLDGNWSPAGIRRMRTELSNRFIEAGVDQGDASRRARMITDAAEQDMIAGLRNAGKGDAAAIWQRASQMRAEYQTTVDKTLAPILGLNKEKTGAEVTRALTVAAKNNPYRFRRFMALLPEDERGDIQASIIGRMGNPGSGGQDSEAEAFSLAKLLTHWSDLKDVRNHVFPPATVKAIDGLARIAERAKQAGHVENHSNTGSIGVAMVTAGPASAAPYLLANGQVKEAFYAIVTSAVLGFAQAVGAKMLVSTKYAQTLAGLANAARAGSQNGVKSQIGRLQALAATNPEIKQPLLDLERKLFSGANDNAMSSAAASDTNTEEK
jgi:hypothetical protein